MFAASVSRVSWKIREFLEIDARKKKSFTLFIYKIVDILTGDLTGDWFCANVIVLNVSCGLGAYTQQILCMGLIIFTNVAILM